MSETELIDGLRRLAELQNAKIDLEAQLVAARRTYASSYAALVDYLQRSGSTVSRDGRCPKRATEAAVRRCEVVFVKLIKPPAALRLASGIADRISEVARAGYLDVDGLCNELSGMLGEDLMASLDADSRAILRISLAFRQSIGLIDVTDVEFRVVLSPALDPVSM